MQTAECLWFESALLPQGWARRVRMTLQDGRIARIETDVESACGEERHAIAIPGMPNVHSHAFQRAMAGLTEVSGPGRDSFWTWRELMYRFLERLGPEEVEAISAFAFMEMLETGFTRVGEFHYLHHDPQGKPYADPAELTRRIVAAAQDSGIGLTLLPVLYAHANFGGIAPSVGQRRFIHGVDGFARLVEASRRAVQPLEDAVIGVAPHSLRAVTPQELREVVALAPDGPIHIHAAEQIKEVDDCIAWSGRRPVEWLLDNVPVDRRWSLIHSTHISPDEMVRLAKSQAIAGLCPVTEANLGDGIFPALEYLNAGGSIAMGTDSNILIDAASELRFLEYSQRLSHRSRNALAGGASRSTGRRLFEDAVRGGSHALGRAAAGFEEGVAADIVTLHAEHPSLCFRRDDAWLDGWIFAARENAVDCVLRRGHRLVSGGRHIRREAITRRFRQVMDRLLGS